MSLFRVFVDIAGTRLVIHVKSSFTIARVREFVAYKHEGIHDLPLIFKGTVLLESKTIADYGIGTAETIYVISHLKPDTRVLVKSLHNGTDLSIHVNKLIIIEHVKQFIYEEITSNGSWNEISLIFDGRELEDEKRLTEYNIRSGDTLNYKLDSGKMVVPVTIQTQAGKTFNIFADTSYTVMHLKTMIYIKEEVACDQQRLIYRGLQLEDEKHISDYGIEKECLIHLVYRLRGGGTSIRYFLFSDVTTPFETRRTSATDPSYRQFCNGVSSEGVCVNPECVIYSERFICQHGYGVYRVNEDPTKCPECQVTSRRVDSFGFSRANVMIRTMPIGMKQVEIRSNLSEARGDYAHLPYLVLYTPNTNRDYEFIEVFSCALERSITPVKQQCSECSRALYWSSDCDYCQPLLDVASLTL